MKTHSEEQPLCGRYPLRAQGIFVDKSLTHHWLESFALKSEVEWVNLTAQDQKRTRKYYQPQILMNKTDKNVVFFLQTLRKLLTI